MEQRFFRIKNDCLILTPEIMRDRTPIFAGIIDHDGPILSTVGFNSHRFATFFYRHLKSEGIALHMISDAVFHAAVVGARSGALEFYRILAERGRSVYFASSPQIPSPTEPASLPTLKRFEKVLIPEIEATGARHIETRDAIEGPKGILAKYAGEGVHGNLRWAGLIFERLFAMRQKE